MATGKDVLSNNIADFVYDVQGVDEILAKIAILSDAALSGDGSVADLVGMRHEVWRTGHYPDPPVHWPPPPPVYPADGTKIPEASPDQLTAEVLHNAISKNSCLLVRGLMSEQHADELIAGTERALSACTAKEKGEADAPWFTPFVPEGCKDIHSSSRHWAGAMGTIFAADSPRNFSRLLEIFGSMGVFSLLTDYFGVRPVISVPKTALKRVAPGSPGGWHQDMLAYGKETRALNMWVALSSCGRQAPGLALVPINPGGMVEDLPPPPVLVPISDETIKRLGAEGAPVQEPAFEKGDVLFFDTVLPHQTQQGSQFTRERYALECWFFSPTTVTEEWLPLHV